MSFHPSIPGRTVDSHSHPWLDHYPACVRKQIHIASEPLPYLLERSASLWGTRPACIYYDQVLTYEQAFEQSSSLAAWLMDQGLAPGDRVAVLLPNCPEYLVALNGIWLAGGTAVALSPLFVAEEVESFLKATDCRIVITLDVLSPLICSGDLKPELVIYTSLGDRMSRLERLGYAWVRLMRLGFSSVCPNTKVESLSRIIHTTSADSYSAPEIDVNGPAYILPTGGTTSSPKAVTLSHRNLMANATQISEWSGNFAGRETFLSVLPFFHSYGLSTCLMTGTYLGATLVLHHRFRTASVLRLIQDHRPTVFPAVPAMLSALNGMLEKSPAKLTSIRAVISGGAALPQTVAEKFSEMTGAAVVEGYGLSEASPVTHAGPLDGTALPRTIGLPLPNTDARIVDVATGTETLPFGEVGELVVRGPQVMLGYWNAPEETAKVIRDGWLHTGDLATCDENGFFRVVDRKKDLIITNGFNVYPTDVEEVLRKYPGVADVAVVGIPNEDHGELVKAIVVMRSGKTLNRSDFDSFSRKHLAAHKRPRLVEESKELPKNFLGKVLRRELRDSEPIPTTST
ncbi:MAG: long-chain fatty acid--CoA ligase [Planctomycetaceae bacterium]|nr:long-chain fatty acid--CoA ligase [Planctomycetaceae bacterium]